MTKKVIIIICIIVLALIIGMLVLFQPHSAVDKSNSTMSEAETPTNETYVINSTDTTTAKPKNYDENIKIAYINENNKETSGFAYYNDLNKDIYNWNSYIIEKKTITKNMEDIDFSKFGKLDNLFYSLKITDAETYNEYAEKYNFRKLNEDDFENIFVDIIIRKSANFNISCDDMFIGYENYNNYDNKGEKNYTIPIKTDGILDVDENFKYPCIVGYFPNYMYSPFFDFLPLYSDINVSSKSALEIAQNYLSNLSYCGIRDFSTKDYLRLSNEYENNFIDTENKEQPIIDENKRHTVWSISAYSADDPCTWANVYIDVNTGKIIGGQLNYATD